MANKKWSETAPEGLMLKRILTMLDKKRKKLDRKGQDPSLADITLLARTVAYVAEKKTNLAKQTDWEDRLKVVEHTSHLQHLRQEKLDALQQQIEK